MVRKQTGNGEETDGLFEKVRSQTLAALVFTKEPTRVC